MHVVTVLIEMKCVMGIENVLILFKIIITLIKSTYVELIILCIIMLTIKLNEKRLFSKPGSQWTLR